MVEPMEASMELNYPLTKEDWAKIYAAGTDLGPELTIRCENGEETKYIRLIRCEDCKYYEVKDYWADFNGMPVLVASNQPTCMKWGGGDCATNPDGYCYLAERKEAAT